MATWKVISVYTGSLPPHRSDRRSRPDRSAGQGRGFPYETPPAARVALTYQTYLPYMTASLPDKPRVAEVIA
ncbi:MAG: hypothetical protein SFU56_16165 [Capsulimonadales bacterium]|nr:hypothetical protein [Capsulimonadales bacterium]